MNKETTTSPDADRAALPPATCSACLGGSDGLEKAENLLTELFSRNKILHKYVFRQAVYYLSNKGITNPDRNTLSIAAAIFAETLLEVLDECSRPARRPNSELRDAASTTSTSTDHAQES